MFPTKCPGRIVRSGRFFFLRYTGKMEETDEELVARHVRGDESAFEALTQRYLKTVYSFIYRFVGSETDAEDITQETFFKIWKGLRTYNQKTSKFKTWALHIARNSAIDYLRKRKQVPFSRLTTSNNESGEDGHTMLAETLPDTEPLPDEIFSKMEDARMLGKALEQLSPAHREVLLLHYTNHLSFEEIGKTLDEPANTVKSRHHRALLALREVLRQDTSGDPIVTKKRELSTNKTEKRTKIKQVAVYYGHEHD